MVFAFIPCVYFFHFSFVSPEFAYRAGLGVVPEGTASVSSPGATAGSGSSSSSAPNRPLPPTPDDDESQGDRTLIARKVCCSAFIISYCAIFMFKNFDFFLFFGVVFDVLQTNLFR